jgi:hypothetical protein
MSEIWLKTYIGLRWKYQLYYAVCIKPIRFSSFCVLPGLTFSNSTFCPHSVFTCFVWISEQTATISLYSINWLVFITETECVYCAVRTGYLYIVQVYVKIRVLPTQCIYVFCVHLRTNSDYFPIQHQLTGFYNRDGVCLLRGTDWVFICNSG